MDIILLKIIKYVICGFSDIVDGFIARKTGKTSNFGAKIDSIADMIMVGVLLFLLYPIIKPTTKIVIWVILISIIRMVRSLFMADILKLKKVKNKAILFLLYLYVEIGFLLLIIKFIKSFSEYK